MSSLESSLEILCNWVCFDYIVNVIIWGVCIKENKHVNRKASSNRMREIRSFHTWWNKRTKHIMFISTITDVSTQTHGINFQSLIVKDGLSTFAYIGYQWYLFCLGQLHLLQLALLLAHYIIQICEGYVCEPSTF